MSGPSSNALMPYRTPTGTDRMEQWERDQIRSANARLRSELDAIQTDFDREIGQLSEIHGKLAAMKVHATSPNKLARVTVNASGMVTEITIADDAYRRSTPQQLTEDLNAAIRGGVEAAAQAREKVLEPVKSIADGMADLSEMVPGAPSLRDLQAQLSDSPQTPPQQSR
ncbi:YbaB/EbfC family nucleoid-associated protein [Nocardia transvalensis]|uniref:YbaB/EbfC family nucleoid-associated protein n=1 Tax=Nocardia transvalensis TaxID=37333 RepID=UPI001894E3F8|nr:YbaB/EbfC family nucleoid-associated protein [Nocardia transvalensis]MBF6332788.1 YbaB/EbfC family nucleoid-associated protein [Nocardia transvalensis]